jgi:tRNA uridine 5-carboxymethylaminomethyl modification enzyme
MIDRNDLVQKEIKRLKNTSIKNETLEQILRRPGTAYSDLPPVAQREETLPEELIQRIEFDIKYQGYLRRQDAAINRFRRIQNKKIPPGIKFDKITGISKEAVEKLTRIRPPSFAQASQIPGITSCDLSLLAIHIERMKRRGDFSCDYVNPSC